MVCLDIQGHTFFKSFAILATAPYGLLPPFCWLDSYSTKQHLSRTIFCYILSFSSIPSIRFGGSFMSSICVHHSKFEYNKHIRVFFSIFRNLSSFFVCLSRIAMFQGYDTVTTMWIVQLLSTSQNKKIDAFDIFNILHLTYKRLISTCMHTHWMLLCHGFYPMVAVYLGHNILG